MLQTDEQEKLYYPELDGLRFFAFLLVFINHAPYIAPNILFRTLHDYGWIGVDLFICLSAFLITRLLLEENEKNGNINIRFFYLRRLLKIWPLYFLFILLLIGYQISNHDWSSAIQLRMIGMALFADNIFSAFLGYNHLFSSVHLWTVSYEEQFYLIIPWVLRKLTVISNKARLIFILSVFIILSVIRIFFIYEKIEHPSIWVLPITHFESLLGGMALGLGIFDQVLKRLNVKFLLFVGVLSIGLVTKLPNMHVIGWSLMLTYPLIGFGMTLIIYSVLYDKKSKLNGIFRNEKIVSLGKISYGLYVYHILCLTMANHICLQLGISSQNMVFYPIAMIATGMTLVILLAQVSYLVYEKPFLELKKRFSYIRSRPV